MSELYPYFLRFTACEVNEIYNKKKYDHEYQTCYPLEHLWLKESGIRYEFVKNEDGITIWKYKKNAALFDALSKFYKNR